MVDATIAGAGTRSRPPCGADFHIIAPDLRGHGDSDYLYDLAGLIRHVQLKQVLLVGHSMGGMIGLMYAGAYPDRVSRLAVLDGVTVLPGRRWSPIHERINKWVAQLDDIAGRQIWRYQTIEAAAERMLAHNKRLTASQALYLAEHGLRRNSDGSFSWKFDAYQRARAPYRLSPEEHIELWSSITCPTLLLHGDESPLPNPAKAGVLGHFNKARFISIAEAGHWLHHDRLAEVLTELRPFLAA
jgi:pimeloyl-ACP methyl ester carboxylesterase